MYFMDKKYNRTVAYLPHIMCAVIGKVLLDIMMQKIEWEPTEKQIIHFGIFSTLL